MLFIEIVNDSTCEWSRLPVSFAQEQMQDALELLRELRHSNILLLCSFFIVNEQGQKVTGLA
jgi:hypothetical protein